MADMKYRVIKTPLYLKGFTNIVYLIGKELDLKLSNGEAIEVTKEQLDVLKSKGLVTLEREDVAPARHPKIGGE